MNNPDTEGVINSINEFTQYISDHGEIAEGFRTDINTNKKAIEDHEALAAQTYETKEDATSKYDELAALVGEKAIQADWNQNDPAAADYVKNRSHYDNSDAEFLVEKTSIRTIKKSYPTVGIIKISDTITWEVGQTYYLNFNGEIYQTVSDNASRLTWNNVPHPANPEFLVNAEILSNGNFGLDYAYDYDYDWANSDITFYVYSGTLDVKQLDEKFIPDSIARTASLDGIKAKIDYYEKNRTHYYDVDINSYLLKETAMSGMKMGSMGSGTIALPEGTYLYWMESKSYYLNFDGVDYPYTYMDNSQLRFEHIPHPADPNRNMIITLDRNDNKVRTTGCYDVQYDWANSGHKFFVYSGTIDIKQLDEKFIPNTIARVTNLLALDERITTSEADIDALEAKVGDKAVSEQIEAAIADAKTDASNKDAVVLAEITAAVAQHNTDKAALEAEIAKKANDADLAAIAKTGSTDDLVMGSMVLVFDCGNASV
jgi:hypothetical protein